MFERFSWLAMVSWLVAACGAGDMHVATSRDDPSNPAAPEGVSRPRAAPGATNGSSVHAHASADAGALTVYTCPMHPEVTSPKPGTCPTCGMHLVPKK